jgi:hypothetical protein
LWVRVHVDLSGSLVICHCWLVRRIGELLSGS